MANMLADGVFQIGFVVPDIHKAMTFFKGGLGVPEFLFIEKPELQDETYLGKPAPLHVHLAFGWCGDTQIELIEPVSGVSTYSKFLDQNAKGGMHHLRHRSARLRGSREGHGGPRLQPCAIRPA